jgi:cell division protein FtsZ
MAIQDFTTNRRRNQARENWAARTSPLNQEPARIKVVGVGNASSKRVERMMRQAVPGMTFAMVTANANGTETSGPGVDVIQIGSDNIRAWSGLEGHQTGIGGPNDSPDETSQQLRQSLADADLVFVTAGMGGGTGTSAAPYVARLAKEQGAFVMALVTAPFSFEGRRRMGLAIASINRLRPQVDNLILVHNDRLLSYIDHRSQMAPAFQKVDEVVTQAMIDLSGVIN